MAIHYCILQYSQVDLQERYLHTYYATRSIVKLPLALVPDGLEFGSKLHDVSCSGGCDERSSF